MPVRSRVAATAALHELEYAVVDVETTGHARDGLDRLIEVAAVVVRNGAPAESFSALVNPRRHVPPVIVRLTGITNTMLSAAPPFSAVAGEFASYLSGRVFVAHNVGFDYGFVKSELERTGNVPLDAPQLCTVKLARRLLSHLPRRNLDALSAHYDITISQRHRALGDAAATAQVFSKMLYELGAQGVHTWGDLNRLMRGRKRVRAKRTALPTFFTDWRIA